MKIIENAETLVRDPEISILCITYNQVEYIADALDSFLVQKTEHSIEILVNDDCSTDGTLGVLMSYQERRPDIFRIISHEENQYARGISPMGEFLVPLARGKNIAMWEGDDYCTDPDKLELQFRVMESNPSLAACVHAHENVQASTKKCLATIRYAENDCRISEVDAATRSQCYSTNSLFVRADAMRAYRDSPIFELRTDGDHKMLVFFCLLSGGIWYIDRVMSAYRMLAKNSVNRSMLLSDKAYEIAQNKHDSRVALLELVDEMTDGERGDLFAKGIDAMDYAYCRDIRDLRSMRKRWPERLQQESFLGRVDLALYTYCRPLHKLALKLYCRL